MVSVSPNYAAMPTQPQELFSAFDRLAISYTLYHHEPVFRVGEGGHIKRQILACHTRNMFLRTKKKENILITLQDETPVDLKKLEKLINMSRFSFGSPDRLMQYLGVYPGSVTPFSVMNAKPEDITIFLDKEMMEADLVAYHPLINTMTVTLTADDLLRFMHHYGHRPSIIDLTDVAP